MLSVKATSETNKYYPSIDIEIILSVADLTETISHIK